jgi:hypothetical protein
MEVKVIDVIHQASKNQYVVKMAKEGQLVTVAAFPYGDEVQIANGVPHIQFMQAKSLAFALKSILEIAY